MNALQAPHWLTGFFVGAGITALLSLVITHWWKIGAHTAGAAGAHGGALLDRPFHPYGRRRYDLACIAIAVRASWPGRAYLDHHTRLHRISPGLLAALGNLFLDEPRRGTLNFNQINHHVSKHITTPRVSVIMGRRGPRCNARAADFPRKPSEVPF